MDNSQISAVEWFHGYGGNALGLKRAIPCLRSVAVCERNAFVVANMVSKMEKGLLDSVPIWTDVTDFPHEPFGYRQLDLFIASFPCQGFSLAGKRLGTEDHRHLWPSCIKFVRNTRPRMCWFENVEGLLTTRTYHQHPELKEYISRIYDQAAKEDARGRWHLERHAERTHGYFLKEYGMSVLHFIECELESEGYEVESGIFSASEVCAPHQRKRIFILAYDKSHGWGKGWAKSEEQLGGPGFTRSSSGEKLAHSHGIGLSHGQPQEQPAEAGIDAQRDLAAGGKLVADLNFPRLEGHSRHDGPKRWEGQNGSVSARGLSREPGYSKGGDGQREAQRETGYAAQPNEGMGNSRTAEQQNSRTAEHTLQGLWPSRPGECQYEWEPPRVSTGMENPECRRSRGRAYDTGTSQEVGSSSETSLSGGREGNRGESDSQTQPEMGGNSDGAPVGMDFPGCTGLSDSELAEIYEWMVKGTNRIDELRMCGNGVVPQTAERAFRVLAEKLWGPGWADAFVLGTDNEHHND